MVASILSEAPELNFNTSLTWYPVPASLWDNKLVKLLVPPVNTVPVGNFIDTTSVKLKLPPVTVDPSL